MSEIAQEVEIQAKVACSEPAEVAAEAALVEEKAAAPASPAPRAPL